MLRMSLILCGSRCSVSRYKGQKCSQGPEQSPLSQSKRQLSVSHANAMSVLAGTDLPEPHGQDHLQRHFTAGEVEAQIIFHL